VQASPFSGRLFLSTPNLFYYLAPYLISVEKEIQSLRILHMCLCTGILLFMLSLHFFIRPINLSGLDSDIGGMTMVGLCVGSICLLLSNIIFGKRLKAMGTQVTSENLAELRGAYLIRWILLEGACLTNVLLYFFIESHPILIVVALLLLLLLYVSKPKIN